MTIVYFIRNRRACTVKIGTSDNPRARLSALQTGTTDPLELAAEMPGDERYEGALHERFAPYRVTGEWFRFEGEIEAFVSMLPRFPHDAKPLRRREPKPPIQINRDQQRACNEAVMAPVRRFVEAYGVDAFADGVDSRRTYVVRALMPGGDIRFKAEWLVHVLLLAPIETRDEVMAALFNAAEVDPSELDNPYARALAARLSAQVP